MSIVKEFGAAQTLLSLIEFNRDFIMNLFNLESRFLTKSVEFFFNFRLSFFLLICFILGGTSQNVVAPKLVLYFISSLIIGICLSVLNQESRFWRLKSMNIMLGSFLILHLLYLIPIPPDIWSSLPGRSFIAKGYLTIGSDLPWLPLSVTPEKSFYSLFDFLPPIALILMMGTIVKAQEMRWALGTISIFVIFLALLGLIQKADLSDNFYFYRMTNRNSAVGFFSNANHYGLFLLMALPLIMCLTFISREVYKQRSAITLTLSGVCILSVLIGVGLSGSLGGFIFIIPVLIATLFIWTSGQGRLVFYGIGILGPLIAALLLDMFLWGNLQSEALNKLSSTHSLDRHTYFANTMELAKSFFPVGSGPGSFADVYKIVEEATWKTVPHAHNDYIEIYSEFGVLGLTWMLFAFFWVLNNIRKAFYRDNNIGKISKFFSISITVVLIYSMFDYSLRTLSVMTFFVFCLCVLTLSNQGVAMLEEESD